ncbi:RNA 2',3'-cyclic phosphodiesterase [Jhaorihella thermophila]|uniref:RNA 2',3'-cyclic phosphodiesterase n=1 Tax=Jhaorihella thermophila TaxID=488547 RepID=A0A1H5T574_9RHOB|nr:RNA 2',3'-cyclic phosphodiesterase [Jhaorihella thermophila]SEF57914.1 2'-5' RNA ligase [Jhaorihella thermophila]
MRAFLAIGLPDAAVRDIRRLQARLPVGRAVPRDNLHLTLAFLDDQPEEALEALDAELQALRAPGFDLRLSGLGVFGGRTPRVLFVVADPAPDLLGLREQVLSAARRAGIQPDRTRYRPHVTIARFGRGLSRGGAARLGRFIEAHGNFALPPVPVRAFGLFRSILHHEGAVHEELASYPLVEAGG